MFALFLVLYNLSPVRMRREFFQTIENTLCALSLARFDGGLGGWSDKAVSKISALMARLQPQAVAFQGPTHAQPVRWVGNENGHAAAPNWIASNNSMANGHGSINGDVVAPAEVDTPVATGQSIWWWAPSQTIKSLRELQIEYDNSVGHNANLLLGVTKIRKCWPN
eukprot:SAG31_NODE_1392_length_8533_cov_3.382974_4_plen_166_part_00